MPADLKLQLNRGTAQQFIHKAQLIRHDPLRTCWCFFFLLSKPSAVWWEEYISISVQDQLYSFLLLSIYCSCRESKGSGCCLQFYLERENLLSCKLLFFKRIFSNTYDFSHKMFKFSDNFSNLLLFFLSIF